tara:strand:+ start:5694 stop:6392 length:699 start_codon:yes stop_codon:yes gene_type:complete
MKSLNSVLNMKNFSRSADRIRQKKRLFLAREQNIIDAARELCLLGRFSDITVSKIAARAGIGKGTIYKHFDSKVQIFLRIVLDYEDKINKILIKSDTSRSISGGLLEPQVYLQAKLADPKLARLIHRLENYLNGLKDKPSFHELHLLRNANAEILGKAIRSSSESRMVADLPDQYHHLACWSLAYAAIELYVNENIDWNIGVDDCLDLFSEILRTISFDSKARIHDSKWKYD